MWINLLLVGAGSFLGGVCRYLISRIIQFQCSGSFPWGTFVVNIIGCFIIGLIYGLIDKGIHVGDDLKLFMTVGFCGGFTTFSTFSHENYLLFNGSEHLTLALYTVASIGMGFLMVYMAYFLIRNLIH